MGIFQLRTFGGLAIEGDGAQPLGSQRKSLLLLAVVAAAGTRGVSRDRLLGLFWPESDEERARGALKQSLHTIRRQLRAPELLSGISALSLNPDIITSDVEAFRDALTRGDDESAARLYTGPFLDGVFADGSPELDRLIEEERLRLAAHFGDALERLALAAEATGNSQEAVRRWRLRQASAPASAPISLRLMRALASAGDRAGALQHAKVHEALLRAQLDLPPDPAVMALAEELRAGGPATSLSEVPSQHAYPSPLGVPTKPQPVPPLLQNAAPPLLQKAAPPLLHNAAPRPSDRRTPWLDWRVGAVLVVVAIVAVVAIVRRDTLPSTPTVALVPNRVAVAVFTNRTGARDLDAIGTMASDWVTRGLTRTSLAEVFDVGGMYVAGRASDGEPTDPRVLARANGAGIVVAGNYYKAGDRLMFSVQLLDVASGRLLRALEPISADQHAPLAGVEEVRQRVAVALGTVLDPRTSIMATPAMVPPRLDAYTEYAAAQEIYWRGDWESALPHVRRAAALDSGFTSAIAFVGVVGVGTGRCGLADSVARVLRERSDVDELDLITAQISVARCTSDHRTHNRLQRERAQLLPGSRFVQLLLATGFRQLNQPAEALAILQDIKPERDLGWLPVSGRPFYWREVSAVQHALLDYRAEQRTAERMRQLDVASLGVALVRGRSMAGLGYADSALAVLDDLGDLPAVPSLVAGISGRLNPVDLATPGWVMWQIALELGAHDAAGAARVAAERAAAWFDAHDSVSSERVAPRLIRARVLEFLGRLDEARQLLDALVILDSTSIDVRGTRGVVAMRQGDTATARATERWLQRAGGFPPGLPGLYRAQIAAVGGEEARALALLDNLPHQVHPLDILHFHIDPAFHALRRTGALRRWVVPGAGAG